MKLLRGATFLAVLATLCGALGSSAQGDIRGGMRFAAEGGFDPESVVWIAPGGARMPVCVGAPSVASHCSARSWYSGPGRYRLEAETGPAGARVLRAIEFGVDSADAALDVAILSNGHATFTVLERPLASALLIEQAPRDMRTRCPYVIRNADEYAQEAPLDAWLTASRSLRDDEWLLHVRQSHHERMEPGERRCITVHSERAGRSADLRRLVAYAGGMLMDAADYRLVRISYYQVAAP
jgi:hypothetical protein